MEYTTYISASEKMRRFGQIQRADDMILHAKYIARLKIDKMKFGILIGEVKIIENCKYQSSNFFKSGNAWRLNLIFINNDDTYVIKTVIDIEDGKYVIRWEDGNKFSNRKSVLLFEKLIEEIFTFEHNINNEINIDFFIMRRTFYL